MTIRTLFGLLVSFTTLLTPVYAEKVDPTSSGGLTRSTFAAALTLLDKLVVAVELPPFIEREGVKITVADDVRTQYAGKAEAVRKESRDINNSMFNADTTDDKIIYRPQHPGGSDECGDTTDQVGGIIYLSLQSCRSYSIEQALEVLSAQLCRHHIAATATCDIVGAALAYKFKMLHSSAHNESELLDFMNQAARGNFLPLQRALQRTTDLASHLQLVRGTLPQTQGNTSLLYAALNRHLAIVDYLMDQGAEPEIRNGSGFDTLAVLLDQISKDSKSYAKEYELLSTVIIKTVSRANEFDRVRMSSRAFVYAKDYANARVLAYLLNETNDPERAFNLNSLYEILPRYNLSQDARNSLTPLLITFVSNNSGRQDNLMRAGLAWGDDRLVRQLIDQGIALPESAETVKFAIRLNDRDLINKVAKFKQLGGGSVKELLVYSINQRDLSLFTLLIARPEIVDTRGSEEFVRNNFPELSQLLLALPVRERSAFFQTIAELPLTSTSSMSTIAESLIGEHELLAAYVTRVAPSVQYHFFQSLIAKAAKLKENTDPAPQDYAAGIIGQIALDHGFEQVKEALADAVGVMMLAGDLVKAAYLVQKFTIDPNVVRLDFGSCRRSSDHDRDYRDRQSKFCSPFAIGGAVLHPNHKIGNDIVNYLVGLSGFKINQDIVVDRQGESRLPVTALDIVDKKLFDTRHCEAGGWSVAQRALRDELVQLLAEQRNVLKANGAVNRFVPGQPLEHYSPETARTAPYLGLQLGFEQFDMFCEKVKNGYYLADSTVVK